MKKLMICACAAALSLGFAPQGFAQQAGACAPGDRNCQPPRKAGPGGQQQQRPQQKAQPQRDHGARTPQGQQQGQRPDRQRPDGQRPQGHRPNGPQQPSQDARPQHSPQQGRPEGAARPPQNGPQGKPGPERRPGSDMREPPRAAPNRAPAGGRPNMGRVDWPAWTQRFPAPPQGGPALGGNGRPGAPFQQATNSRFPPPPPGMGYRVMPGGWLVLIDNSTFQIVSTLGLLSALMAF